MELNVFDFYYRCLSPLAPPQIVSDLLSQIMAGGETTEDIGKVLGQDPELTQWVRLTVQRTGFGSRAKTLGQLVTTMGQSRIRDLIVGRSIERRFVAASQSILGEMLAKAKEEAAKQENKPAAVVADPAPDGAAAQDTEKAPLAALQLSPEEEAMREIIPNIADFKKYLPFAEQAEEVAIAIKNSYPGQAYAGGVLFDFVQAYAKTQKFEVLSDDRLKKVDQYIQTTFQDGLRSGILANEIIQKISIPHQKNAMVAALIHNIGKILLLCYDPAGFEKAFLRSTGCKEIKERIPSHEAETEEFDFDHAQVGALYLGRAPFLAEVERALDFHHNAKLLKFSDPPLYALSCVMIVCNQFQKLYQAKRAETPDVQDVRDARIIQTDEFKFLKLNVDEWMNIKASYVLQLMKAGL